MRKRLPLLLCLVAAAFAGGSALHAKAQSVASLYVGPPTGTFAVGDTFTVSVYLNTGGQAVNAVQVDLAFPANELQVVSPSTGNSFIQIWVAQPSFSNISGKLDFQGTVPTPGINTSAGLVSTITFRVVNTGTAIIKFLDSSKVLLNNGQGTDVLSQTTDGIYTLTLPPPAGPSVTSPTNPDQSTWYQGQSVALQWSPADEGFSYVLDNSPVTTPDNVSEGTGSHISYNNLSDGIYYFHIKSLHAGIWGGTTHYAIRVDNTAPAAFSINVSPGTYTSDQDPIVTFQTTDAASGLDHYDLKFISLDLPAGTTDQNNTSFFIEASSPYTQHLPLGRYDVVVRAYDGAGNFYQASQQISIVNPLFQIMGTNGLRIVGLYVIPWPYAIAAMVFLILLLGYGLSRLWKLHRAIELRLADGAASHPDITAKLAELQQKQKEYEEALKKLTVVFLVAAASWAILHQSAWAAVVPAAAAPSAAAAQGFTLNPPIINLYPTSLANDEVLYLGGWANVPNADVVIHIEQAETGDTYSGTVKTGSDGSWFYSFPQLLDAGHYIAWTELSSGNVTSPPSARVDVTVAPTALEIGSARLDYQEIYLALFLITLLIAIILFIAFIRSAHRLRGSRSRLEAAIRDAEGSLRRGFSVLRKDIEREFAHIQKVKGERELAPAELAREEKVKKDLVDVNEYIGREIWKIEEEEKKLKP